MYIGKPKI